MYLSSSCVSIAESNGVIALVTGLFLFFFKLPPIKLPLMSGGLMYVCVSVLSCRTSRTYRGGWGSATKASASTICKIN